MAEREEKVESTEIVVSSDGEVRRNSNPNPIFSFFQKLQLFIFPPPLKRDDSKSKSVVVSSEQPMSTIGDESVKEEVKPVAVKVPNPCPDMPSLKLQADECDQNTNPIVLWQVYAIGGFFILRWALARWKERMAKKKLADEETSDDEESHDEVSADE
ncbi:hypothetical protein ACSBR2_026863 [Camellia fascicularis]